LRDCVLFHGRANEPVPAAGATFPTAGSTQKSPSSRCTLRASSGAGPPTQLRDRRRVDARSATYRRYFAADLLQMQRLATVDTIFGCGQWMGRIRAVSRSR
jgi:hypothetical protein